MDKILDGICIVSENKRFLRIGETLPRSERVSFFARHGIDFTLYSDGCFGSVDEKIGSYSQYVLDENKVNKDKYPLIRELFKKLSNDNRYDFDFQIYFKYSANVKSLNRSYSGSYDYGLPERMKNKDLTELKKYFKTVKFEGRYDYEGGFGSDGYLWIVDFYSINTKAVQNYLKEEIFTHFELGKTYKLQEDFILDEYQQIKAGTIFKVIKLGSGWNDQRKFEIISGFYKLNKNKPITEIEVNKKTGVNFFSYDPHGISMPNVKIYELTK